jgi:hypothetical protein
MMNQQDIFKKIGLILNELQDQYEFLAQNPSQLNELELELFLANANFLSDHVQIVRKINNQPPKQIEEHSQILEPEIATDPLPVATEAAVPEKPVLELPAQEAPVADKWENQETISLEDEEEQVEEVFRPEPEPHREFQDDLFKLEEEPVKFEFLLNEEPVSDKFDFEEKSIDHIFDRPLSKEEERIIAEKQSLLSAEPIDQTIPEVTAVEQSDRIEPVESVTTELPLFQAPIAEIPVVETPVAELSVAETPVVEAPVSGAPAETPVVETTPVPAAPVVKEEAPRLTLNDLLAGRGTPANVNEGNKTPITNLGQAINLNEKLLYIKDLFNGYNLAYAEAIELVNKMPDFKTADNFLKNNYSIKNNWASKQSTVDQFYELLNRRFPVK